MENIKLKAIRLNENKEIVPLSSNIALFSKINFKVSKQKLTNTQGNTEESPVPQIIKTASSTENEKVKTKRSSRVHSSSLSKGKNSLRNVTKTPLFRNLSHKKSADLKPVVDSFKLLRSSSNSNRKTKVEMEIKTSVRRKEPFETATNSTLPKSEGEQALLNTATIEGPEDLHMFNVKLMHSNKEMSMKFDLTV